MSRPRRSLAARLFLAQTLVALTGAATLWLVASAVGPPSFHEHLRRVAGHVTPETSAHVEEAFRSASVISIGIALLASLAAALAMSAYVTRRIARPIGRLAAAVRDVADGHFGVRVTAPGVGSEFATLTESFNQMAERLQTVETTRRRLLADLAHEMRTPVATLDAYLEGAEDGVVTLDSPTIQLLRGQTTRLARLSEDVTAVSRAEEHELDLRPVPVTAAALIHAATGAVADRYAAKGVTLSVALPHDLPPLHADTDRIGQVLGNLLDNALRHTPPGGTVSVTARRATGAVLIVVADTGDGIPAEHLPHVFERFYRVDSARDRAHGGSGIGLAIAKALVEAHGGSLTASSAGVGAGAVFAMELPIS